MIRRIALSLATVLAGALLVGGTATATPLVDRLLATAVHADVQVVARDGSTSELTFDRGKITSISETSLTIQRRDGQSVTFTRSSTTRIRGLALLASRNVLVVSRDGAAVRIDVGSIVLGLRPGSALLDGAVHAEVTTRFANGRTRTVAVDKGRVISRTATELVIRRADGQTVDFALAANTRATYGRRGAGTITRLRTNAWVKVVSENGKALSISTTAAAFARS